MADLTTWFTFGAVGMAVGTLVLAYGFRVVPAENRRRYALIVAVPLIAFGAYVLLALDIGAVETQSGDVLYVFRYLDWLLTTPLHVLYLGLLAGATLRTVSRAMVLMVLTIVFGVAGAYLTGLAKWGLFALGSLAFAGVIYFAVYDFDRAAQGKDDLTLALYRKLRAFLIVLWLMYPVIWLLAPIGLGVMNITTSALVLSYLDVVAKVGFGLIALSGQLSLLEVTAKEAVAAD